ncbi:MAG: HupE/UreJ family protein [Pseudomonadota bacterium]
MLCATHAIGHEVRPAYLQITVKDGGNGYDVLWKQPVVQNGRLAIDPVFPEGCQLKDTAPPEVTNAALLHRWTTDCDLSQGKLHISGLSVTLTDVMVRLERASGDSDSYILRPESPTLDLGSQSASAWSYLIIGVEHLLFGIDHVLFVVGLVLFITNPWMLLKTITAFTIAHSITLFLSVMGWVQLQQGPVEAVIALSILFLARELVQAEDKRSVLTQTSPWIMAFVFGLLHGLGFAGALSDIGLPEDALWLSLLLFNVGLELGQLMVIAALFMLQWLLVKFVALGQLIRIGAYSMGCIAAYWTIDRTLLLM